MNEHMDGRMDIKGQWDSLKTLHNSLPTSFGGGGIKMQCNSSNDILINSMQLLT